jgi:arylsulfatase A-like enzyme
MSGRPNILFLFTDQQFAGAMSCAGNPDVRTPAMDALAARGMRFERAYCAHPVCGPSRASMITGLMPLHAGVHVNELGLDPQLRDRELGTIFNAAGYRCAYAGKWHLAESNIPDGHGFERIAPMNDEAVTQACESFFKQKQYRPFLLMASLHNPHDICPWAVNAPLPEGAVENGSPDVWPPLPPNYAIPENEPEVLRQLQRMHPGAAGAYDWPEAKWRQYRYVYYRLVEKVDALVGRVLNALDESGYADNTLVIFSSDHGEGAGSHRWNTKATLYEESVRIPFIMSFKNRIPAGRVDGTHLISNGLDLLPTLCDYAGIQPPPGLIGRSIRPLVEDRGDNWREDLVSETAIGGGPRCQFFADGLTLIGERYKYMVYSAGAHREHLVDLQRDPGETKNLAADPQFLPVLQNFRRRLREWCAQNTYPFEVPA